MGQSTGKTYIVTDVGSTTTKALLLEQGDRGWRLSGRGESPTTVEAPDEDVVVGVTRAIRHLENETGQRLLDDSGSVPRVLTDAYLSTSSAGGGLQMVVCGNVGKVSGESAQRAALGGGAVLLDVFSADDDRSLFARMERLRTLRPDMILLSGGIEQAEVIRFMLEMCDFLRAANPRSKFGYQYRLPVIYAGNSKAAGAVADLLGDRFEVRIVPNLRPTFDEENLEPTRVAIHDIFIDHVMAHAPGYPRLKEMATSQLMPTPVAVGEILQRLAGERKVNLLCADIGGATTDVFSVVDGHYHRTVSANYGMSYSSGNVLAVAGVERVRQWLPIDLSASEVCHRVGNKMIYPTTIPATVRDLMVEQALAREALRLSLIDHRTIAKVRAEKSLLDNSMLGGGERELVQMSKIGLIIGSGGVLSHAPLRGQAAAMLIDAFEPEGVTELAVDSVFMLPHLGILASEEPAAALELLDSECLVPLGACIAPTGRLPAGAPGLRVSGHASSGRRIDLTVHVGDLQVVPLAAGETAELTLAPVPPLNVGAGIGIPRSAKVRGGASGIIIDLRGRPLAAAQTPDRGERAREWLKRMSAWPAEADAEISEGVAR
ncbi:MAG: glutamate mutase L [Chloroflexota bacterium]